MNITPGCKRQPKRLLSTPIGTPRHTVKKTYVDLIERYAHAEGLELKDVVNLALYEFFERRHYLPEGRNHDRRTLYCRS